MMPRKKIMIYFFFVALFLFVILYLLGWLRGRASWEETTGWNHIPRELRPAAAVTLDDEPWIRWLGHSGFIIRWHGVTLLLDPNENDHCTVSKRIMDIPPPLNNIGPAHVLISHAHFDHLNQDTLVTLPQLENIFIPSGSELFLDRINRGTTCIVPVRAGVSFEAGALRITPVPAAHNGNRFHPLKSKFTALGYIIQSPSGTSLYYAGDTAYNNGWSALRETYHPDIAILPIGAYSPRIPLKKHHMNPEETAKAAAELGVKKMIPCHFGTFTLSFDRPGWALPRFARAAKKENLTWEMPTFLTENDVGRLML